MFLCSEHLLKPITNHSITAGYVQRHVRFSPIRDRIHVSCISRQILYCWVTREDPSREMLLFRCPVVSNSSQPQGGSQASLSLTVSWSLPKFMFIASVMSSSHLILWWPLLLLLSIFPSIRDFSNESAILSRWPKYWSFSINPSNEHSGLICLKINWFDLLVQGTLRNLLQHHSSKASVLWPSAFFMVQFSHPLGRPQPWLYGPLLAE